MFYANGDYLSHHGGQYGYAGRWRLDGDCVELLESPLDECGVPRCQWTRYEFRLEVRPGGVLAGESVRLSNRRLP